MAEIERSTIKKEGKERAILKKRTEHTRSTVELSKKEIAKVQSTLVKHKKDLRANEETLLETIVAREKADQQRRSELR